MCRCGDPTFDKYYRLISPDEVPKYREAGVKVHQSRSGKYYAIIEPGTHPLRSLKGKKNSEMSDRGGDRSIGDKLVDVLFQGLDDSELSKFFMGVEKIESGGAKNFMIFGRAATYILEGLLKLYEKEYIDDDLFFVLMRNFLDFIRDNYGEEYLNLLKEKVIKEYFGDDLSDALEYKDEEISRDFDVDNRESYIRLFRDMGLSVEDDVIDDFIANLDRIKRLDKNVYATLSRKIKNFLGRMDKRVAEKFLGFVRFLGVVDIVSDDDKYTPSYDEYKDVNIVMNKVLSYYFGKRVCVECDDKKIVLSVDDVVPKLCGRFTVYGISPRRIKVSDVKRYIEDYLLGDKDFDELLNVDRGSIREVRFDIEKYAEYVIRKYGKKKFDGRYRELDRKVGMSGVYDRDDFIKLNRLSGCYDEDGGRHFSIEYEYVFSDVFKNDIFDYEVDGMRYPYDRDASLKRSNGIEGSDYAREYKFGFLRGVDSIEKLSSLINVGKDYGLLQTGLCGMHVHVEAEDIIDKFFSGKDLSKKDKYKIVLLMSAIFDMFLKCGFVSSARDNNSYARYVFSYMHIAKCLNEFSGDDGLDDFIGENCDSFDHWFMREWVDGGKHYIIRFDKNKKTLEYRFLENMDNSPVKMRLNVEIALRLTNYIKGLVDGKLDVEFDKLLNGEFRLRDVLGDDLYDRVEAYSRERKIRQRYLREVVTKLGMFEAQDVKGGGSKNTIMFKLDEKTGELYRVEIDGDGNRKVYDELGRLVSRGD